MRVTKEMMLEFERRNEDLFDEFFKFYSGIIYYYVNKCDIVDDDADDCVQEIITNIIRCHNTFRYYKGCYEKWIFHLVTLHTQLYVKEKVRRKHYFDCQDKVFRVTDFPKQERKRILSELEEFIGEVGYAILVLRMGYKQRFRDISQLLDINYEAIRRRYIKARLLLWKYSRGKR